METGERLRSSFTMSTKDIIVMEFNLRRKHISRQLKSVEALSPKGERFLFSQLPS